MRPQELEPSLLKNRVFARMQPAFFKALVQTAEVMEVSRGDRVLEESDPSQHLYALTHGVVGVFYSSNAGADVLVKIFGAPAVFGEMELVHGQPRQEYVEAFEDCVVVRFDGKAFMATLHKDAPACFVMLEDVAARLCIAAYNERALAFLDAPTRLAGLFLSFLEAYGQPGGDGITLGYKLTYDMLARCLGVTARSIDRTMTTWMEEGWVRRSKGLYTFRSMADLEARSDPEGLALFSTLGLLPHRSGLIPKA
jgi:CRP-like cAMP-binding protein